MTRNPVDGILKLVALAAAAFSLYWLGRLYFVATSARSIDIVAEAVTSTLVALTIGIAVLIAALVARLVLRRKRVTSE